MSLLLPRERRKWRHFPGQDLPVTTGISRTINGMDLLGKAELPDLRRSRPTRIASDYVGQDKRLKYRVTSFVIVDRPSLLNWAESTRAIRRRFLPNGEHISFKTLRHQATLRAIEPFLRSADRMEGILVAVAVDKNITSLFGPPPAAPHSGFDQLSGDEWDARTFEASMRTTHFVSMFLAGLVNPDQPLLWISDPDDMIANLKRSALFTGYWAQALLDHAGTPFHDVRFTTPKGIDDPLLAEDLLALPDLAAAAVAESLTDLRVSGAMPSEPTAMSAIPPSAKLKVEALTS
jgi:hypothetical protein